MLLCNTLDSFMLKQSKSFDQQQIQPANDPLSVGHKRNINTSDMNTIQWASSKIYLADLYFYISLSEHFISDNLQHEIFQRNLCAQMPHCDSLIFSIACVELMDLAQELDNHRNGYKYLCWRFFLQGRNESCLFR